MKCIYICGPFTASTNWLIKRNVRIAEKLSLEVAKLGHSFICPHKNSEEFFGLLTPEYWYEMTLELLRRCDAVLTFGTWANSKGATREVAEAGKLGMPIFDNIAQLRMWLDKLVASQEESLGLFTNKYDFPGAL
jgi:hypothetical protein